MLTAKEQGFVRSHLEDFTGQSYAEVAASLTEKFGRAVTRSTARYYLSSIAGHEGRAKGRPSGAARDVDIWDLLLPELLALTGLSASRLFRDLTHALAPERLPFGESAFHERTGRRSPTKGTGKKKIGTSLLDRCNLRIKVVETYHNDAAGTHLYLFGYEELTGYTAFDAITRSSLTAQRISNFVKEIEEHLGLPVRRICLVGSEFSWLAESRPLEKLNVQRLKEQHASSQINSPYKRSAEIDLLQRLTKKQNDGIARAKATIAKEAISHFVHLEETSGGVWKTPAQRRVARRQQADAKELKPFLGKRFKLHRPKRRPT
ncbi:hypothetical protein [Duganella aceris]|uniref:Transposase n=1 Tax=Duganella aceris TaxID=2703883 RepID=A0ABX0FV65_9BURK|nr:hypothetical protein [Duganella aceris]NGZ88602.1 hypothetical protein [Duganella aceris]